MKDERSAERGEKSRGGGRAERSGKMQREEGAGAGLEEPGEKRKGARAASPQERLSFPDGRASFFLRVRGEKIKLKVPRVFNLVFSSRARGKEHGGHQAGNEMCPSAHVRGKGNGRLRAFAPLCGQTPKGQFSTCKRTSFFVCAACLECCRIFARGSSCAVRSPEKVCRLSDCVIFARDSSGRGLHALSSEIFPAVSPNGRKG